MKIGIIGNGNVGSRIEALCRAAGHDVRVGARDAGQGRASFRAAATHGEVVVLAIPYGAAEGVLDSLRDVLRGSVVIDATNPLEADWSPMALPGGVSAGELNQLRVPETRVVKAFNTIFADAMRPRAAGSGEPSTSAFLCGDDADARATVARLLAGFGWSPVDAGPLRSARYLEAMAHLNIQIAVGMGQGTAAVFHYHHPSDFVGSDGAGAQV